MLTPQNNQNVYDASLFVNRQCFCSFLQFDAAVGTMHLSVLVFKARCCVRCSFFCQQRRWNDHIYPFWFPLVTKYSIVLRTDVCFVTYCSWTTVDNKKCQQFASADFCFAQGTKQQVLLYCKKNRWPEEAFAGGLDIHPLKIQLDIMLVDFV